ncbi:MAG TPA: helix-turn-helix domain-containing protein [Chitinophagaceae bacterium]|nr:helix-turn-helix domain-containing protein [Chitinophagaceae bacterium]
MKIFRAEKMFSLPQHMGKGIIHQVRITYNAWLVCWNIRLQTCQSFRTIFLLPGTHLHLVYTFSPKFFKISHLPVPTGGYLIMSGANLDAEYQVSPGHQIECMEIFLQAPDESVALPYDDCTLQLLTQIKQAPDGARLLPVSHSAHHALHALYQHAYKATGSAAYAEGKLLSLLSDLVMMEESPDDIKTNTLLSDNIAMIDKWLDEHIDTELPPLRILAEQASLSVSSLNRQFKSFCGKSIYEAYLHKKMKKAKEMMEQPFITVNEVAYKLGYEKVSNFITIFKRFYQLSPGQLKRKRNY